METTLGKIVEPLDETISADVLVLGGGIAGCFAAIKARELGADVVMVDKGNVGRSGESHQMSGVLAYFDHEKDDYDVLYRQCVMASEWLADQKRLGGMIAETTDRVRDLERWGVHFQKDRGKFVQKPGLGHAIRNVVMTHGGFQLMSVLRGEVLRRGVSVVERVMATDLLSSDGELPTWGSITGAVGFHIRTGKFYVFKAKATIIATGSTAAAYLRMSMPNLSGDGKAMAFRAGCETRNREMALFLDTPRDFNCAPGSHILYGEGAILVNASGERFMERYDPERLERASRAATARAIATEEMEVRGPVYLDATHLDEAAHHRIEMAIPIVTRSFAAGGLDLRNDRIPYTFSLGDYPGGTRAGKDGATILPGLYAAGAASDFAEDGAVNIIGHGMESAIGGYRAGEPAAKYAADTGQLLISESQVRALRQHTFAPMENMVGLSHQEVRKHCLSIIEKGLLGPVRNEKGLKMAIEAAQEISEGEIPKLVAEDYHSLARCIGVGNELLFLEMLARCALLRTESRGAHFREDYPARDNDNWLKWVIAKKMGDGVKVWAEPIPFDEYPLRPDGKEGVEKWRIQP